MLTGDVPSTGDEPEGPHVCVGLRQETLQARIASEKLLVVSQCSHLLLAQEPQLGLRSGRVLREAEAAWWRMTSKPIFC